MFLILLGRRPAGEGPGATKALALVAEESAHLFPQRLHGSTLPAAVQKCSFASAAPPACGMTAFLHDRHSSH